MAMAMSAYIPSPPINSFRIGPLDIHFYALMYLVGIAVAIIITRRRWSAVGGDPELVGDIALWGVPAGIVGGRIYFDITTPMDIPHVWYGVFAVWDGGLGIWGGIALAAVVGVWRLRRNKANVGLFMDAVAPALLVAQGIGRIGNYFNKELFGRPTTLPWGLEIPYQYRVAGGVPAKYLNASTFQPTFLYELIFDFAWAGLLVWLGHHRKIKPPGLFALYVFGYSAYRIFEESLRVDSSVYIFGLRLNMYIASILTVVGAVWFYRIQRRPAPSAEPYLGVPATAEPAGDSAASAQGEVAHAAATHGEVTNAAATHGEVTHAAATHGEVTHAAPAHAASARAASAHDAAVANAAAEADDAGEAPAAGDAPAAKDSAPAVDDSPERDGQASRDSEQATS